jgi:predicted ATPase
MDSQEITSNPRVWIREATFSDGSKVALNFDDIVVLVGPNNSGKSVALKNIEQKAKEKASSTVVVTSVELAIDGDQAQLCKWLERNSRKNISNPSNPTFTRMGASVNESQAKSWWTDYGNGLHGLAMFFVYLLTTDARLGAANPAPNIALTRDPMTHPIHYLQINDNIEKKVSSYFQEAFGEDLVVHRNAGNQVPLHCGIRPIPKEGEDRVSVSYLQELERLTTLHTQGDGMRSFVGVLLHSLVVNHTVIMIDEPEAFLHPPQARLLGQMIVKEAPQGRQLFLATHSGDFLRGLLDTQSNRVRILRIQRNNEINPIKELDSNGIKKVWGDPILRYSNVLDGIFHNKVILCESDGDCRFYAAIMDAIMDPSGDARREHIMFLHCGGKARMPVVVDSLRNLDVPVLVIADFDVLNSEMPLRKIVEALGASWNSVESNWRLVKKAIEDKKPELSSAEVTHEIRIVLDAIQESAFPSSAKKKIQSILRRSSPWSTAKSVGKAYIPSGDPTVAYNAMREELGRVGLFIVPVGELEGFDRSNGGHGPKWVNAVLERDLSFDPELEIARSFVREILI